MEALLRALEPDDLEFLFQLENDSDLWAASDVLPGPISRHALREYLRHAAASLAEAGQMRLIISSEQNQPVGTLDLFDYSALHHHIRRSPPQVGLFRFLAIARRALQTALHPRQSPIRKSRLRRAGE